MAPINDSRIFSGDVMKSCTMLHHIHKLALEIERDYSILHSCIQLQCFRNVELELARVIPVYIMGRFLFWDTSEDFELFFGTVP